MPRRSPADDRVTPGLRFVIQKHRASHLHYDLRLESEGVLKSWAIPKGPSLNPRDKRLAVQVEDHPLEYADFEGVIPEGEYGSGEVIVWDRGNYQPVGRSVAEGLREGKITFRLNGKKLEGEFSLVRLKSGGENDWLLIKAADEFASRKTVALDDLSVSSART